MAVQIDKIEKVSALFFFNYKCVMRLWRRSFARYHEKSYTANIGWMGNRQKR